MKRLAHYSQYFLRSPRKVAELIGHSTIKKTDLVLDIGAGSGVISAVLATRAKRVIAVEYEPRMAKKLRENMKKFTNVAVVEADILSMQLPSEPYKVFANIPFHLSSPIVRRLTEAASQPEAIYLIVQKQFANKLLPEFDRFTGQLGMLIGPLYQARIRKRLLRTDYWPHPNVDTVLLELLRRDEPLIPLNDMPAYRTFITDCFSTPTVFATTPRRQIGFPDDIKPSQMKLSHWVALFAAFKQQQKERR